MYRNNDLRPEQMPPHQRDFPPKERSELRSADGSRALALMVAWYVVAMFAGILLLGLLTASESPRITSAAAGTMLTK
jgi:hypothetical protein